MQAINSNSAAGSAQHGAAGFNFEDLNRPGRMKYLRLAQIKIAYYDSGPSKKNLGVLLLLHGLGEHAGYWDLNVRDLSSAGYRVVAVDLAGHGRSDKPRRPVYSMAWQAHLMIGVLDALGIHEGVTVVGHSMGGHIALRMALDSPNRVSRLILLAPAGIERFTESEARWLVKNSQAHTFASRTRSELKAHFKRNVFGRWSPAAQAHLDERIKLKNAPGFKAYINAIVASIAGMLGDNAARELAMVTQPTSVLFGSVDRLIPNPYLHGGRAEDVADLARRAFKNLQAVEILPGIGHMPQIEAADLVNALIIKWAQGHNGPSTLSNQSQGKHSFWRRQFMPTKLVKRYPNRRLYDTERGAHITLDTLANDLMDGRDVKVIENKTGVDITRRVMLQAMLTEEHAHKLDCLPIDFLRTILQLEDSTMRSLFDHYVRVTLSSFAVAQNGMQQNLELFKSLAPNPTDVLRGLTGLIRKPSQDS